jgi:hypothetical protein
MLLNGVARGPLELLDVFSVFEGAGGISGGSSGWEAGFFPKIFNEFLRLFDDNCIGRLLLERCVSSFSGRDGVGLGDAGESGTSSIGLDNNRAFSAFFAASAAFCACCCRRILSTTRRCNTTNNYGFKLTIVTPSFEGPEIGGKDCHEK